MDYFLFAILLLIFIGLPSFFWIRWIFRALKNKRKLGRVVSILSYLLFLVPWAFALLGPRVAYSRSTSRVTQIDNFLLLSLLLAFFLPVLYFYTRWIYDAFIEGKKKSVYFRLSFLLLFPAIFGYNFISSEIGVRNQISKDLGIKIPYWGTTLISYKDNTTLLRGEGEINVQVELDANSFKEVESQIRQTPFFADRKKNLQGADMVEWPKSDTVFYWNVRHHLEKHKLTGLWLYDKKKQVFEFYEPNLSDIPNAGILFSEDYSISAELDPKNRMLRYQRSQW